jgi:hypothetical protein
MARDDLRLGSNQVGAIDVGQFPTPVIVNHGPTVWEPVGMARPLIVEQILSVPRNAMPVHASGPQPQIWSPHDCAWI